MRKPRHNQPVPRPSLWTGITRPGWTFFAELFQLVFVLAACVLVYRLAGGTGDELDRLAAASGGDFLELLGTMKPLLAALALFVTTLISDTITGVVARARHNRHVNAWYARRHPQPEPAKTVTEPEPADANA